MIRWIWPMLMAAIALIVAGVQLDRQARRAPEIAEYVPRPVRGFSQYSTTERLLNQGELEPGLRAAAALLASRPLPEENSRLYAQAQLLAENEEQAIMGFQMAARRGWRDPIAQEAQLRLALAAGDGAEAGRRLAALWARSRDMKKLEELTVLTISNRDALSSFAQMLAASPRWNQRVLDLGPGVLPSEQYEQIRLEAARHGAKLNPPADPESYRREPGKKG